MSIKKRGIFFSTDALIALTIILLSVLVIYPAIKYSARVDYVKADIIDVLSSLKIGVLDCNKIFPVSI